MLRTGLSSHLRLVLTHFQDPVCHLLHHIARWTGARMTDLAPGIQAERAMWRDRQIWLIRCLRHKKRRFGGLSIWLPVDLIPDRYHHLLSHGQSTPVVSWTALKGPMGDHESWRRGRIIELRGVMKLQTLQDYVSLRACIHVYLRGLPCAIEDREDLWFQ